MGFPNLPGIPPLQFNPTTVAQVGTLAAPLISNLLGKLKPKWRILNDSNKDAIVPDSFLSFDYHNESNLPTFPIEQGAFGTYNKVATPYSATLKIVKGATLGLGPLPSALSSLVGSSNATPFDKFIDVLEKMQNDTKLYSVVTPTRTLLNANLKGYDYKQELHNGAEMIIASLNFVEIMRTTIVVTPAASTTVAPDPTQVQTPNVCTAVDNGPVQAYTDTATRQISFQ